MGFLIILQMKIGRLWGFDDFTNEFWQIMGFLIILQMNFGRLRGFS